jgi:hypothetical protein
VTNVWPYNHVLWIFLSSCVFVNVTSLFIFSVTFCSYVLQLLNISKALTGKFIQTGEFSINESLHCASNNFQLSYFEISGLWSPPLINIISHAEKVLFSMFCHFSYTVISYLLYRTSNHTAVVVTYWPSLVLLDSHTLSSTLNSKPNTKCYDPLLCHSSNDMLISLHLPKMTFFSPVSRIPDKKSPGIQ